MSLSNIQISAKPIDFKLFVLSDERLKTSTATDKKCSATSPTMPLLTSSSPSSSASSSSTSKHLANNLYFSKVINMSNQQLGEEYSKVEDEFKLRNSTQFHIECQLDLKTLHQSDEYYDDAEMECFVFSEKLTLLDTFRFEDENKMASCTIILKSSETVTIKIKFQYTANVSRKISSFRLIRGKVICRILNKTLNDMIFLEIDLEAIIIALDDSSLGVSNALKSMNQDFKLLDHDFKIVNKFNIEMTYENRTFYKTKLKLDTLEFKKKLILYPVIFDEKLNIKSMMIAKDKWHPLGIDSHGYKYLLKLNDINDHLMHDEFEPNQEYTFELELRKKRLIKWKQTSLFENVSLCFVWLEYDFACYLRQFNLIIDSNTFITSFLDEILKRKSSSINIGRFLSKLIKKQATFSSKEMTQLTQMLVQLFKKAIKCILVKFIFINQSEILINNGAIKVLTDNLEFKSCKPNETSHAHFLVQNHSSHMRTCSLSVQNLTGAFYCNFYSDLIIEANNYAQINVEFKPKCSGEYAQSLFVELDGCRLSIPIKAKCE